MKFINRFNDTLADMLRELVNVFPSDSDLALYSFAASKIEGTNNEIISKAFYEDIALKYENQIRTKNETFFMENSFDEYNDKGFLGYNIGDVIKKIKNKHSELSLSNKEIIWKYLIVLVTLSKKIYEA